MTTMTITPACQVPIKAYKTGEFPVEHDSMMKTGYWVRGRPYAMWAATIADAQELIRETLEKERDSREYRKAADKVSAERDSRWAAQKTKS